MIIERNSIKRSVQSFYSQHEFIPGSLDSLSSIIESQGYVLIEFDRYSNDKDIANVIRGLSLQEYINSCSAFTYQDNDTRLVFVNQDLNDQEKYIALLHEEAHIFLGHVQTGNIIGKDVLDEFYANEFANALYYQRYTPIFTKIKRSRRLKYSIALIFIVIFLLCCTFAYKTQKSYYDEYYITATGEKYHIKDCMYIKDKTDVHRLTIEEFESGEFNPCKACLPQLQ